MMARRWSPIKYYANNIFGLLHYHVMHSQLWQEEVRGIFRSTLSINDVLV